MGARPTLLVSRLHAITPEHHWDTRNGRVTLTGDTAHPMSHLRPSSFLLSVSALLTSSERSLGLNHSVTDAAKLVSLLTSEKNQKSAIETYEKR